jgi:hypothetical protein
MSVFCIIGNILADFKLIYPYPIDNFRGLMDELKTSNYTGWTSSSGEVLLFYRDREFKDDNKKKESWSVVLQERVEVKFQPDFKVQWGRTGAVIQAFEVLPNKTEINFYDGKEFSWILGFQEREKIGESFEELIRAIRSKWDQAQEADQQKTAEKKIFDQLPKWWPKQAQKKLRWKGYYRKIKPLFDEGLSNSEISERTGIRRQDISHILEWADLSPEAHDR